MILHDPPSLTVTEVPSGHEIVELPSPLSTTVQEPVLIVEAVPSLQVINAVPSSFCRTEQDETFSREQPTNPNVKAANSIATLKIRSLLALQLPLAEISAPAIPGIVLSAPLTTPCAASAWLSCSFSFS